MKTAELRKIHKKNYIILTVVMLVTILILYYFYMWVDVYKESKINIPIMDKYMSLINYNELSDYVVENPNAIIYASILENEKIREFEKKFKNKYKNNLIEHEILYMNITGEIKDNKIRNSMIEDYSLNNLNITDVPCVLVFNDGKLYSIYSISDNDYNVDKFMIYLDNLVLESDDV